MANILIIDDEEYIRDILSIRIESMNHKASQASTLKQGLQMIREEPFDLIFLDVNLPDGNGLDLLPEIQQHPLKPEVIIITAVGNYEGAEIAIKNGAWDYMTKPLKKDDIILRIKRAVDYCSMKKNRIQPVMLETASIVGKSPAIKNCLNKVAQCACSTSNVLLFGQTGTGKEVFAKAIHDNCQETNENFIVVDCAAMPKELTESVLFGHVKGAFTGANKASEGLIQKADKGTLFLDEIGELPLSIQGAFLRVLQERKFRPVGSSSEKSSDFRLISASNRNLDDMVEQGTFRKDLLYRLKTFYIELPPLCERKEDIQDLSMYYMNKLCNKYSLKNKGLLPETLEFLESYDWPGNVRELINTIESAIVCEPDSTVIYPLFLPDRIRINFAQQDMTVSEESKHPGLYNLLDSCQTPSLKDFRNSVLDKFEPVYLEHLLSQTQWDLEKAAEISGLSKNRIYVLIKKYRLTKP